MAEFKLPPLLAHEPERNPPGRWRVLLLPAILAVMGMLIAWACVTTGQDEQRARNVEEVKYHLVYWENELHKAKLEGASPEVLEELDKTVAGFREVQSFPWRYGKTKYGRQFTQWDGYRYEEIVDTGYHYHMPWESEESKKESSIPNPDSPDPFKKNVVWYPLYPALAWVVSKGLRVSSTNALTVVSWISCLLAAVVLFLYARRHYFNRMPKLDLGGNEAVLAVEQHPARRWDLAPQDTAALWAVAALLFGPCAIFLYANFTESLFVLLLACFLYCMQARWWWRAALVAAAASACRSQGVLFGPVLALVYLLRSNKPNNPVLKVGLAGGLGIVSGVGLACYMIFLWKKFDDPLAFMHGQRYWNVGLNWERIRYAANPTNAMAHVLNIAFYRGSVEWPRVWEALCLVWPPVVLLVLGGRYLSFELEVIGWMMWGLPYVSNSMAGNPPMADQWMSMGRFMAVMIPVYIIAGAVFVRFKWLGLMFIVPWAGAFALFAYKFGNGAWVG